MIIVLKKDAAPNKVDALKEKLTHMGLKLHLSQGEDTMLIGLIGDTSESKPKLSSRRYGH